MLEDANPLLKKYLDIRAKAHKHFGYPVSREHYLQRCWPVIDRILRSNETVTVIDAGCGHAYESILFAALGADVIGIDLREDGFRGALENIKMFRPEFPSIQIELINRDIFAAMASLRSNVVYVRQAFSHIHPAEKFVELAYRSLALNGILVINDSNWLNPLEMIEVTREHWKHRKLGWFVSDEFRDPVTHEVVPYAVERMMTPAVVAGMLRDSGFIVKELDITGFIPLVIASRMPSLAMSLEGCFKKLPLVSKLGAEYTITGERNKE